MFTLITRTDPAVNEYHSPRVSASPWLSGTAKYDWYAPYPIGPLPSSFSWLPAAGIHGRKRAERLLLRNQSDQVRIRSVARLA